MLCISAMEAPPHPRCLHSLQVLPSLTLPILSCNHKRLFYSSGTLELYFHQESLLIDPPAFSKAENGRSSPVEEMDTSETNVPMDSGAESEVEYTEERHARTHASEDIQSLQWQRRRKHFFILSSSGKPIYSR